MIKRTRRSSGLLLAGALLLGGACEKTKASDKVPTSDGGAAAVTATATDQDAATGIGKVMAVGTTAPAAPPAGSTGLASCDAYGAAIDKYYACDKLKESRDAFLRIFDQRKAEWAKMASGSEASRKEANDECTDGLAGLQENAKAVGCPL